MANRRSSTPILIADGKSTPLDRLPLGRPIYDETWLQRLLFDYPGLLPVGDLEPIFAGPVAVARELSTNAGPVDLVLVNESGFITLVETKLWRSPEARRKVVGQILDYAKEFSRWTFSHFDEAVRRNPHSKQSGLVEIVRGRSEDFDEVEFVDSVSRNLRLGRLLLLIVGDGIREEVEHLAEFLQRTPELRFTLGLIELACYPMPSAGESGLLVVPSIVARTQEVVRAVVEIRTPVRPDDVIVSIPLEPIASTPRATITEVAYVEKIASQVSPAAAQCVLTLLDGARHQGLDVKWGVQGPTIFFTDPESSETVNLARFSDGGVGFMAAKAPTMQHYREIGITDDIRQRLLTKVAELTEQPNDGNPAPVAALIGKENSLLVAIESTVADISAALANGRSQTA
jgi:hypothetical protein